VPVIDNPAPVFTIYQIVFMIPIVTAATALMVNKSLTGENTGQAFITQGT
jgi:hypothetical protein